MYVWSIALVALLLAGCGQPHRMTAQEMRLAIDECNKHELRSTLVTDGWGYQRIECRPAKEEE